MAQTATHSSREAPTVTAPCPLPFVFLTPTTLFDQIGLGTTIWSPLASGLLTGKYEQGIPEDSRVNLKGYGWLKRSFTSKEGKQKIELVKRLKPIADDMGCSMAQLAIAWCLKNPNVSTVITGASKKSQVTENMKAIEIAERLNPDVMLRIEQVLRNKPQEEEDFR